MARKRYQKYGKGNRKKKFKYSTKQRGKKRKLRGRRKYRKRGRKGMRLPFNLRAKDAQKYTTIYKTAVRVTSKPGTCNYVSLSQDINQVSFKTSAVAPNNKFAFMGDMSFYGNHEKNECIRQIANVFRDRNQGVRANQISFFSSGLDSDFDTLTGTRTASIGNVPDFNEGLYLGKHKYHLEIKSAITGSNCVVKLYKCKARYSLPNISFVEQTRPGTLFYYGNAAWGGVSSTYDTGTRLKDATMDINTLLNTTWYATFAADNPGQDFADATPNGLWKHQEGTSLYDNKQFCKLFKVVKKYNFELLPGQKAVLNMKDKFIKKFNQVRQLLNKSYFCEKGQVFFILQLQGSMGHQAFDAPDQAQKHFNGTQARPNIGLMPAAVDVMCIKKLNCWMTPEKAPKVRNVVRVQDYYDDDGNENLGAAYFKDSAPSDYADSAAAIG